MMRLSSRLRIPALMLILGTGLAVAEAVGQGWHSGILVEAVAVVAAVGYFLIGGMNNDVGAIYGSSADERQHLVRLRAQAMTAEVTALAVVIGYMVQTARQAPTWPFAVIAAVAAVTFVAALAIQRVAPRP